MSLYLKYRPNDLSAIKGNRKIISPLKSMLKDTENCPHSILFFGLTGCGKTSLARIVTQELGCSENNIIELDTAQFRGIDTIREIRKNCLYTPIGGGLRVYIIDEVHKMTTDAQNAFLKILEDTPPSVYFILCTTDPNSLLPTIRGRCSQFQVEPLEDVEMEDLLLEVTVKEKDELDKEVLDQIILDSQGLPRNALTVLEQVLNTPKRRRLRTARQASIVQTESITLCRALIGNEGWNEVKTILAGLKGQDAESIRRMVLGYATSVLLKSGKAQAGAVLECFEEPLYNLGFPGLVLAAWRVTEGG